MNYEELIKQAPDHNSDDFIVFLMNNNKVVKLLDNWLIIENCKYHNEERTWWTAFYLPTKMFTSGTLVSYYAGTTPVENDDIAILHKWAGDGMAIFQNPEDKRTIGRTHYHITPMQTPGEETRTDDWISDIPKRAKEQTKIIRQSNEYLIDSLKGK